MSDHEAVVLDRLGVGPNAHDCERPSGAHRHRCCVLFSQHQVLQPGTCVADTHVYLHVIRRPISAMLARLQAPPGASNTSKAR